MTSDSESKNLTIMFVDIKGYTERSSSSSREQTINLIKSFNNLVVPIIKERKGHVVKNLGDAVLVTFDSPTDGVLSAITIMKKLREKNLKTKPEDRFEVRASLAAGDVSIANNDIYGEPVNLAARLEGVTPVNEIYFTEAVFYTMNRSEIPHESVGPYKFKGIKSETNVYKVKLDKPKEEAKPTPATPATAKTVADKKPDLQIKKPNIKELSRIPKTSIDVPFIMDRCIMSLSHDLERANVHPRVDNSQGSNKALGSEPHLFYGILSLLRFILFNSTGKLEIKSQGSMIRTADIDDNKKLIDIFRKNQPELLNLQCPYSRKQKASKQVFSWSQTNAPTSIEGLIRLWDLAFGAESCKLDITFSEFFGILYYSGATLRLDENSDKESVSIAIKYVVPA